MYKYNIIYIYIHTHIYIYIYIYIYIIIIMMAIIKEKYNEIHFVKYSGYLKYVVHATFSHNSIWLYKCYLSFKQHTRSNFDLCLYMPYLLLQKFAHSSPLMRHYAIIMESKMDTDNGAINLTDANLSNLKPDHLRFTAVFCKEFYGYR